MTPSDLIAALQAWPPEAVLALEMLLCYAGLVAMVRFFGKSGAYAFIVLAVIAANIQVLKTVQFGFYADPVALGTVLFAATYLATDILNEYYGRQAAVKGVWLGFTGYLLFTVYMQVTLGFAPLTAETAGEGYAWALPYQQHFEALFLPAPAFFLAGMAAYLTSQFLDVRVYSLIRGRTGERFLWLRNNASTLLSALVDSAVFSVLAWIVLAEEPLDTRVVIETYIFGTYLLRVLLAVLDTPFLYLARRLVKRTAGAAG